MRTIKASKRVVENLGYEMQRPTLIYERGLCMGYRVRIYDPETSHCIYETCYWASAGRAANDVAVFAEKYLKPKGE